MRSAVNALDLLSRPFNLDAYAAQRAVIAQKIAIGQAPSLIAAGEPPLQLNHLFVAGLGRCGTTMVMNMLARGGAPMTGEAPAYEVEETWAACPRLASWLEANRGRAVKWIDPSAAPMPAGTLGKTIFLTRHAREQAPST
ncbi:sulfotransferase, partial [Thioclava sp. BHET1]